MASMVPSSKRGRSVTRSSRSASSSITRGSNYMRSRTTNVRRQWPLARGYASPAFDPFPNKMRNILRYSETINMDPGAGVPQHYLFRANSIFDPNSTGVGHQPYGHDTLQSIYNHYEVESAIITITNTSAGANTIVGCTVTDDASVNSDYDTVREIKGTQFMVLANDTNPKTLQQFYKRKATFPVVSSLETTASYGSNPAEQIFFDIWTEGNLPTADTTAVSLVVSITYTVRSWELRDLDQS